MRLETLKKVLYSGVWGTIGPYSLKAAELLAKLKGANHCLLTHSAGAALEVTLRAVGTYHGDGVIVPAAGARLSGFPQSDRCAAGDMRQRRRQGLPRRHQRGSRYKPVCKCAVLDYETVCELGKIYEYLKSAGVTFILWAGGRLLGDCRGEYADAVIYPCRGCGHLCRKRRRACHRQQITV